ncbi:MAG: DUF5682 family protein [Pirellulaceae bacterium]
MKKTSAKTTPPKTSLRGQVDFERLLHRLVDVSQDVIFFPVRHHSPVCAAMVASLIEATRPAAVLIEGPSDYNAHLEELMLDHDLPIAIYSYFRRPAESTLDGQVIGSHSSGAYYPFCEYSPEWVAMKAARQVDARIAFIDLPWLQTASLDQCSHRYADAELRRGHYIEALCQRMQVDDFDELWDRLVESDWTLDVAEFMRRVHALCLHIRFGESSINRSDLSRESFMREQIERYRAELNGPILVVTGGFHSSALAAPFVGITLGEAVTENSDAEEDAPKISDDEQVVSGIALTTYSYERLDNLTGYNSGMPNPGFYEWAWRFRQGSQTFDHHPLLIELAEQFRKKKQVVSTADLIAIETSALGLAALRGRSHVWRSDLVDAVGSALVKDELQYGVQSPFLDAVHAILSGWRRGRLAEGTRLPPLVEDIQQQMIAFNLEMKRTTTEITLELSEPADLPRSRFFHRLRALGIGGFKLVDGTNFLQRADLNRLWEAWELRWTPEFDSSCIEASRYGTTLVDAASMRLLERSRATDFNAADAAKLLVEACRAGIETLSEDLLVQLDQLIGGESEFTTASEALGHLTYLYCYDESLGTKRATPLERLLAECNTRCLWLLDSLGGTLPDEAKVLAGMQKVQEVAQRAASVLREDRVELSQTFSRIQNDHEKHPAVRGAAVGILWNLGAADSDGILQQMLGFQKPEDLGDFLSGLFLLAREVAQRHPQVVQTVDRLLMEFTGEGFQHALPALRLAFTYFTPREKHHMLSTLFESLGLKEVKALPQLQVAPEVAAQAMAVEEAIFAAIEKYGLGTNDE